MGVPELRELRDSEQVRQFLLQGLWLQRVLRPTAETVRPVLEWVLEIAADGQPLPPPGFVADLGHTAFAAVPPASLPVLAVPGMTAALVRTYEDQVLGKVYADATFECAGDALRRFQGRDCARGLAFVVHQFRDRAGLGGVLLSPGAIKAVLRDPPEKVLAEGWESLDRGGMLPLLPEQYSTLIAGARRTAEILAPEDVFELEHGTALHELGQRVALRQVLHAAEHLAATLPRQRLRPRAGRNDVPTRILDEDTYPVGGFSALSTRGTIESLLHSQLAFMEKDERPDLFDVKFLRDELLYYARDENQFLRRRRTMVFVLFPDLVQARFKDATMAWQRIILLLALQVVVVRTLGEWLATEALAFEFLFVEDNTPEALAAEQRLLETVLREAIANGTVVIQRVPTISLAAQHCALRARRCQCHALAVSTTGQRLVAEGTVASWLWLAGPSPVLGVGDEALMPDDANDALEGWGMALHALLQNWV